MNIAEKQSIGIPVERNDYRSKKEGRKKRTLKWRKKWKRKRLFEKLLNS